MAAQDVLRGGYCQRHHARCKYGVQYGVRYEAQDSLDFATYLHARASLWRLIALLFV